MKYAIAIDFGSTFTKIVIIDIAEKTVIHSDKVPFIMGGRLNEPMDGNDVPVDVSDRLSALGINTDNDMQKIVDYLKEALNPGKN